MIDLKEQKRKMNSGELYTDLFQELVDERTEAQKLQYEYNNLPPDQLVRRKELVKKMFKKIEEPFWIEPVIRFSYGTHITIGKNMYANFNLSIVDDAEVTIGDNVMFAPNVTLSTAGHPENVEIRSKGWQYSKPINIGNNVWIGTNVVVHPGVTIGDNTIIGSGSVVTKDIPSDVVAYGIPCRVIRKLDNTK